MASYQQFSPYLLECGKTANMNIVIRPASSLEEIAAAGSVREQVFGTHCYRRLPRLDIYDSAQILTLVAWTADTGVAVGVLSVVETTGDAALHAALDLSFPRDKRVARYTQLAVLHPYRGLRIPASMILEARRRFVLPGQFTHTWLLYDSVAARASSFCKELGFKASAREFTTEYGRCRVLAREEPAGAIGPGVLRHVAEDEWLTQ
jgi:hypothetical protein